MTKLRRVVLRPKPTSTPPISATSMTSESAPTSVDHDVNNATEHPSNIHYPQSQHDQFAAYFYISMLFKSYVPRIVTRILEFAEYWIVSTAQSSNYLVVDGNMRDAPIYLRSKPIVGHPRVPVHKIIFSITSNDQGWSADTEFHNTYKHSWTWFEAGREKVPSFADSIGMSALVPGPTILRNLHASSYSRQHRVCWLASCDEVPVGDEQGSFHQVDDRDQIDIRRWVSQLQCGDRVVIIPRANYSGWRNHVYKAEIRIFTSFVKRSA